MKEQKDFYVKDVEPANENTDGEIAKNIIFAIAGFTLAGVALGVGEQIFGGSWVENFVPYVGIGITTASISAMREKLKDKSGKNKKSNQYSKGKK